MKFCIISGSTRVGSQSSKVSKYIENYLNNKHHSSIVIDFANTKLKEWDQTFWGNEEFDTNWTFMKKHLEESDALVVIAPEWDGTIPSALKNFFHFTTKGEIANKPALIVSVSSGQNGVYPVTELRSSCYKNSFLCYIPQHVIIRFVNNVLNNVEEIHGEDDKLIRDRLHASLDVLAEYSRAFSSIRQSDSIKNYNYPYGM
jgi:NAD(P)H-dependent FMN reductase